MCVAMLPGGEFMVSGGDDNALKVWRTVAPFECVATLKGARLRWAALGCDCMKPVGWDGVLVCGWW